MLGSLYTGSSGVKTHSRSMTVTGSNIANVNTIGFKGNRVNFQDFLSTSIGGATGTKIGQGVEIGNVQTLHTQGTFENTELETDIAIDGDGFLTVRDREGNILYTRSGQLTYDKDGYLTTKDGKFLQVKGVDENNGNTIGTMDKLNVLDQLDPPTPTGDGIAEGTGVTLKANLDANAVPPEADLDLLNVTSDMYNFSTAITVIDQQGNEQSVNVVFRKQPDTPARTDPATGQTFPATKNGWQWMVLVPGENLFPPQPGVAQAVGGGFLRFSDDGRLNSNIPAEIGVLPVPPGTPPPPPTLNPMLDNPGRNIVPINFFSAGGAPQDIGFQFGLGRNPDDPADARTGLDGVTQFAAESGVHSIEADGMRAGKIENIHILEDGTINGAFDSGKVKALGRVVMTDFNSKESLAQKGRNYFVRTPTSGTPVEDDPGKNGMGRIHAKSLERSNVDLSDQFVKMIEGQRAFQANAKTVTISDEILADVIQMKR